MSDPARVLFKDAAYDGQLGRSLTGAYAGAADIGQVLAIARRIGKPTAEKWWREWSAAGDLTRLQADSQLAAGRRVSASTGYLRASEYYRQAIYFSRGDPEDTRLLRGYQAHVDTFEAAARLFGVHAEQVQIPYDGTALNGWFFAPDESGKRRPTLLMPCGYDSTAEADWGFMMVEAALERGYNVLRFEGPGQGQALYRQRLYFRPDFEHVLTQVMDWVLDRPDVRTTAVALVGRSFAGYLAPRAATVEHRLAALVCDPAQPDMGARLPQGPAGRIAPSLVRLQMRFSADRAEFFKARMAGHGLRSIGKYFAELRKFTMIESAAQITCPTLIVEAEKDFAGGGGQVLFDALTCQKRMVHLTVSQGADGHCGGLGQLIWAENVYGWLDGILFP